MYVGVDIGGTFTDVVAFDPATGRLEVTKVPSTPPGLVEGFLAGVQEVADRFGQPLTSVQRLAHGTTIATNAILEHRGAKLGILTTEGFRDVLVLGRMKRSNMYDVFIDPETPLFLAPRRQIREVRERLDSDGGVVVPLDTASLDAALEALVEYESVEALVVCYLHAYANAEHEEATARVIAARYPSMAVSLSSDVDPRFREYERLLVTAFDAYVRPVIVSYVGELSARLREEGITAPLQLMQSRGGLAGAESSARRPVNTVLSGPAAGVIGAASAAAAAGFPDAVSIDVGGTSADVALILGGVPAMTTEARVDRYPLRLPTVDVRTVGAGGGSVAWIDEGGVLKVGPRSAGAVPGPAAYGRGGSEPAVTDASLVLGYLSPEAFAGGLNLDRRLAAAAVEERIAAPMGLSAAEAALGIHRIINSRMAQALRLVTVERGHDPRGLTLVALGGAGPVHAGRLAEELHIPRVLVPPTPGVLSALGLLLAGVEHDFARTLRSRSDNADPESVQALVEGLDGACRERMAADGVDPDTTAVRHFAEMRYVGQSYELEVPLAGSVDGAVLERAVTDFHAAHERTYGYKNESAPVEFVSFRSVHIAPPAITLPPAALPGGSSPEPVDVRDAWFAPGAGPVPTRVYDRTTLPKEFTTDGPAIIVQPDTTTVVYPGHTAAVDAIGNIVMSRTA